MRSWRTDYESQREESEVEGFGQTGKSSWLRCNPESRCPKCVGVRGSIPCFTTNGRSSYWGLPALHLRGQDGETRLAGAAAEAEVLRADKNVIAEDHSGESGPKKNNDPQEG